MLHLMSLVIRYSTYSDDAVRTLHCINLQLYIPYFNEISKNKKIIYLHWKKVKKKYYISKFGLKKNQIKTSLKSTFFVTKESYLYKTFVSR